MIAGPSEILIVADETANPKYLAADLMSQAEHDVFGFCNSAYNFFQNRRRNHCSNLRAGRAPEEKILSTNHWTTSVQSLYAIPWTKPLNLQMIWLQSTWKFVLQIHWSISAVWTMLVLSFLGNYSPEPLGDYYAGPNHVLPTSGTARFFSPLSVDSFIKKSSFIYYTQDALKAAKNDIVALAEAEGLTAHANSIKVRSE